MRYWQGRYQGAPALDTEALRLSKELLGTYHQTTLSTMKRLASSFYELGQYAEIEKLLSQVLELARKRVGEHHPDFLATMYNLSKAHHQLGHYKEAETLMSAVVTQTANAQGLSHSKTQLPLSWLTYMQQQHHTREKQAGLASNHHHKVQYLSDSESEDRWYTPMSGTPSESGDERYTTSTNDSSEDEVSSRQGNKKETPRMSLQRLMPRAKAKSKKIQ